MEEERVVGGKEVESRWKGEGCRGEGCRGEGCRGEGCRGGCKMKRGGCKMERRVRGRRGG